MDGGSFWSGGFDFGCVSSSAIDEVLSQEDFTLEDLLDHEDIIQECKYLNNDLIEYLQRREVIAKLVSYVISKPRSPEEEAKLGTEDIEKMKYHYIASELFACEVTDILDILFENQELLQLLFSFLDRPPPLDPCQCAYFCKVVVVLISKRHAQLVNFILQTNQLEKILTHIGLYSVMELLIRIGWDDGNQSTFQEIGDEEEIDSEWLHKANLVPRLIAKMDPCYDSEPEIHVNAACALIDIVVKNSPMTPQIGLLVDALHTEKILETLFKHMFSGSGSSLTNSLSIVIVLVQSDTERRFVDNENEETGNKVAVSTELSPILKFAIKSLPKLVEYLKTPTELDGIELLTQSGKLSPPVGQCRLKIVELVLAMVRAEIEEVNQALVTHKALIGVLDMFFEYPWNNMLHRLVENIIHTIMDDTEEGASEETDPSKTNVSVLKKNMFCEAHILSKISQTFEANTRAIKEPKGCRLGHMGHILRICASISSCSEGKSFEEMGVPEDEVAAWLTLVDGQLSKDINQQQEVLGGDNAEDETIQEDQPYGRNSDAGSQSNESTSNDGFSDVNFGTNFDNDNFSDTLKPNDDVPLNQENNNKNEMNKETSINIGIESATQNSATGTKDEISSSSKEEGKKLN